MTAKEYLKKLPKKYTPKELEDIRRAFEFASEIHKDEKRLTGGSYIDHPIAVSLLAVDLNMDAQTIISSLLHDTYETDKTTLNKIRKHFGQEVAFLVKGLSKFKKIKYRGIERNAESTRKMFMAAAKDIRVIIIKLLDRFDNLGTLHVLPEIKQRRIAMETLEIYAPIADRLGISSIKSKLEDRAFKYAYPEEYAWIINETNEKTPRREAYLQKIMPTLSRELAKENIAPENINFRAKHYYSLWKKLLRKNMDWYSIYDLAAARIIVDSTEMCYATLGVIHKLWKPLPGKIKDYIALPKPNGYQSLHTSVFCVDDKITEFQIRTKKMHEEAEFGIAAHWAWEMAGKPERAIGTSPRNIPWIKQLHDWQKKFNKNMNSEEFLKALKIDFFSDRVFVLTPRGDIIDLPEGATPVDFAYHIHSNLGDTIIGAKVNNKIIPLSSELYSGDMVEIIRQKNKKPSIKLLDNAKTSVAKNHIKSSLKKQGIFVKAPKQKQRKTHLKIAGEDRIGLINDITSVITSFGINMESIVQNEPHGKYANVFICFIPKNKKQVPLVVTRLKKIKGVEEVDYKIKN
ncbi:RelA/SpoT family protein [Patescibacteria group bacterium]